MKVHPVGGLTRKRDLTININNPLSSDDDTDTDDADALSGLTINNNNNKKLRRLPHVFSRVLQLPLPSDAEVSVHESPDSFRFVAETDDDIAHVEARTVQIYPGVTKIVVTASGGGSLFDELELDMWRFRLPDSTLPELATAVLVDGELTVTVPKENIHMWNNDDDDNALVY